VTATSAEAVGSPYFFYANLFHASRIHAIRIGITRDEEAPRQPPCGDAIFRADCPGCELAQASQAPGSATRAAPNLCSRQVDVGQSNVQRYPLCRICKAWGFMLGMTGTPATISAPKRLCELLILAASVAATIGRFRYWVNALQPKSVPSPLPEQRHGGICGHAGRLMGTP